MPIINNPKAFIVNHKKAVLIGAAGVLFVFASVLTAVVLFRGNNTAEETLKEDAIKTDIAAAETPSPTVAPTETPRPTAEPTETPKPTEAPTENPTAAPTAEPDTRVINLLTGEKMDEQAAKRRPVAVVINNAPKSLPQSGLSQACMYYEVLAEGDLTRIITLFHDFEGIEKVGSIRSARDYFFYFAYDHDALFVHHGGSPEAYKTIRAHAIDYFDGQDLDGTQFWRDPTRWATPGMKEHSSYTKSDNIWAQAEKYGYRTEKADDWKGLFAFYDEPTSPDGGVPLAPDKDGFDVTTCYLPYTRAQFAYNEEERLFYKWQNDKPHVDAEFGGENGLQLSVANIIIQEADTYTVDKEGRRSVKLVGAGRGYLATNGVYVPIKWRKDAAKTPTVWTFEDGSPLKINVGKTWVCVVADLDKTQFGAK